MNLKINLLHFLCFVITTVIILCYLQHILPNEQNPQNMQQDFVITARRLIIPNDNDLQELKKSYEEISTYFTEIITSKQEMIKLHSDVKNALVCSEANKYFNSLEKHYNIYNQKIQEVKNLILQYEKTYNTYFESLSNIPKFSSSYEQKYEKFVKEFEPDYKTIQEYKEEIENFESLYLEAKQIADKLFEEYFDLMCHIVNAEAGISICTSLERCYVANVIENRIKSAKFPNTLYDVIYNLFFFAKLKESEEDIKNGRVMTIEESKERIREEYANININ